LPKEVSVWEGEAQLVISGQDTTLVIMSGDCPVIKGDRIVVSTAVDETTYTVKHLVGRSSGAWFLDVVKA
jgi:hypothetical protein